MKIGVSYGINKLHIDDLVQAKQLGLDFIEFGLFLSSNNMEALQLQIRAIRDVMDSYDLFSTVHLPHLPTSFIIDEKRWEGYQRLVEHQLEIIGKSGITNKVNFHGVFGGTENPPGVPSEKILKAKYELFAAWKEITDDYSISMFLENTDETPKDLEQVFADHPDLGFTLDIGQANICYHEPPESDNKHSMINDFLATFPEQLEHLHVHDNFGGTSEAADIHLPIGLGTIDFFGLFTQLKKIGFNKTIVIELYNPNFHHIYLDASLQALKKVFKATGFDY